MKKSFLAILLAVFVFASCEKQELQNLDVKPQKNSEVNAGTTKSSGTMVTLHNAKINHVYSFLYRAEGYIKVKNVAYDKQVSIRYTADRGQTWQDLDAEYFASVEDDYEIWKFTSPTIYWHRYNLPSFKFAIKYVANGQECWDNNSGNDYHLNVQLGSLYQNFLLGPETMVLGSSLSIKPKNDYQTIVEFEGHVQNIGYEKQVLVVFTYDNWVTRQVIECSYAGGGQPIQPGIETWKVTSTIPVSTNDKKVEAYIQYSVNGQTFWDNNFMKNYIFDNTNQ